jgi:predicted PurR-regulated permease PerM
MDELQVIEEQPRPADVAPPPAPAEAEPPEAPEPERVLLHMPVDVRSAALVLLAVLASVVVLHWAKAVFIPLLLGVMFSYALEPIVARLERWRVPRALGAALLIFAILGGIGWTAYALADDAKNLVQSLPDAAQKLRQAMRSSENEPGTIDKVQKAANELEKAAEERTAASGAAAQRGVTRVQVEKPKFDVREWLLPGTLNLIEAVGQAVAVCFITYFLLAAGSTFRRKMVKIAGPTFTEKRVTVQALDEISGQIERYLLVQLFTSVVLGIATWLAFLALGLQHAAVWGLLAGVTNLIPYVGAILVVVGSALVGFVQFGAFDQALFVAGSAFAIHTFIGYWLTPWLTSRAGSMNPVVIFAGVLAWGWLWGVWGLLLGAPILMVVKSVCDRVDDLKPIGELLGE